MLASMAFSFAASILPLCEEQTKSNVHTQRMSRLGLAIIAKQHTLSQAQVIDSNSTFHPCQISRTLLGKQLFPPVRAASLAES